MQKNLFISPNYKLRDKLIRHRREHHRLLFPVDDMRGPRLCRLPLQLHERVLILGFFPQPLIQLNPRQEILPAL